MIAMQVIIKLGSMLAELVIYKFTDIPPSALKCCTLKKAQEVIMSGIHLSIAPLLLPNIA